MFRDLLKAPWMMSFPRRVNFHQMEVCIRIRMALFFIGEYVGGSVASDPQGIIGTQKK